MNIEQRLSRIFAESHPLDAAQTLEGLTEAERGRLLEALPLDAAVAVLRQMEASVAAASLAERQPAAVAALVAAMPVQNGVRLLERFDGEKRDEVLGHLPRDAAVAVRRLMQHADNTAGALMEPRVAAVPADITVDAARKRVQREPRHLRYYVYVVDRDDRLVGVINLRELMLAPASARLASVMRAPVESVSVGWTWDAILAHPGWREFHALPVVDREGVLAGVLRYETLRRLEADSAVARAPGLLTTGLALGELYWSAATALLLGAFDTLRPAGGAPTGETHHGE